MDKKLDAKIRARMDVRAERVNQLTLVGYPPQQAVLLAAAESHVYPTCGCGRSLVMACEREAGKCSTCLMDEDQGVGR